MDQLHLNAIGFPVRSAELSRGRDATTDYRWGIEINCGESPQLDYDNWPDDREEGPFDWLAGLEPYLYAQMLPFRVAAPDQLVGRRFSFPQSPDDDPADWPDGIGWPFFSLYLSEHSWAYPIQMAFTAKQGNRYRVEIEGSYPESGKVYDLRVQAWLDWRDG